MLVDWFIVVAQIINFLILVALLRWFLYKPVLSVMGKRKAGIERQWNDVRQRQNQAEAERAEHQQLREQLEARRQVWLEQARQEVEQERRQSLERMRQEVQEQRHRWQTDLEQERQSAQNRISARLLDQVQVLARRALADLASADLEEQVITRFLDRLQQLEPERRRVIEEPRDLNGGGARLRTGFALSGERREALRRRLAACLPNLDADSLMFEHDPQLLCGIELRTAAEVIRWSLADYLAALEHGLADALSAESDETVVRAGG